MPKAPAKTCFLARYSITDGTHEHHDYAIIHAVDEATAKTFASRLEHDTLCMSDCTVCNQSNLTFDRKKRLIIEHPFSYVDGETSSDLERLIPLTISQAKLLRNIFSFLEYNA